MAGKEVEEEEEEGSPVFLVGDGGGDAIRNKMAAARRLYVG